jgi:pimeloyl-ACP methyl ester carboxylesterase
MSTFKEQTGPIKAFSETRPEFDWSKKPSNVTFQKWQASYGLLYFIEKNLIQGTGLLVGDPVSFEQFRLYGGAYERVARELLLTLPKLSQKKLYIGDRWGLLPGPHQEADAKRIGATFHRVEDASHFVMCDQPDAVAALVEEWASLH